MKNEWKLEGNSNHIKLKRKKKNFLSNKINIFWGILFVIRNNNKNKMIAATEDQGNSSQAAKRLTSIMSICFSANYLKNDDNDCKKAWLVIAR
jgi:hypothetical protein